VRFAVCVACRRAAPAEPQKQAGRFRLPDTRYEQSDIARVASASERARHLGAGKVLQAAFSPSPMSVVGR
jgi:hypothetical protein